MNESVALPVCAKCENKDKPVTPQNGFGVPYRVEEHVFIELFLHEDCADEWYQQFGPSRENMETKCVDTDRSMKHAPDAMLEGRIRQRAYEIFLQRRENPA